MQGIRAAGNTDSLVSRVEKITSRRNPLCMHMRKLGESRGYRQERMEFLCDGLKLLHEALSGGAEVLTVLTSAPIPLILPGDIKLYQTDRELIGSLSPLKNAQDVLFTCRIPAPGGFSDACGTHILLDEVQDPGNVGAVIRTAFALGLSSVILTGGCADPYNPKAIRASMGAIFRQDIHHMDISSLQALRSRGVRFVGAALRGGCRDISKVKLDGSVLSIGNEGRGLSGDILSLCDELVTIPISPECESLNAAAAAAIFIWEASRQAGTSS
jgi:TrmH family RNA methyltransferase